MEDSNVSVVTPEASGVEGVESAVAAVMASVEGESTKGARKDRKMNRKQLAAVKALPFYAALNDAQRMLVDLGLSTATPEQAVEIQALFPTKAPRVAGVAGPGSRAPRAIQPPVVEAASADRHKLYHVELVGIFMVGHANTAKGWVVRPLIGDAADERTGDLKAGKAAAIAYAEAKSPKGGKAVAQAKAAFAARTVKDGKYGLVADGRNRVSVAA